MVFDPTVTSTTVASILSISLTSSITLFLNKRNQRKSLDDQLDNILKISIQYPYLESDSFTLSWDPNFDKNDDKYLRYDIYCTLLFNFLFRVSEFYRFDKKKIEDYIAIKEWVRLHEKYWKNPTSKYENLDGYEIIYVNLINSYLR